MTCCNPLPPRRRACRIAGRILLGILLGAVLAAVFGTVVMWLWTYTLPALFKVRPLHFWQAVALLILARILVGGHHGWHHRGWHRHGRGTPGGWCGCGREEEGPGEPEADVRGTEA